MPFTSQKQRGLFYAAKANPEVRKRTGISQAVATKMTGEDQPGKLPLRAPRMADGGRVERGTREELDPGVAARARDIDVERLRGYARGGHLPSARVGDDVIVGERGPELFRPDRPGTVIPNHVAFGTNPAFMRGMAHGGHFREGSPEEEAGETAAEERAEQRGMGGHRAGTMFHGGVHVHHNLPGMARGGRVEGSGAEFGTGEPMRRGYAPGALGGDLPMQPNEMSSQPDAAQQTARPKPPPEPQGRSTASGPGKSRGGGKLATFGALHGLRRGPSPNVRPKGNPPAASRPNTKAIPHHANPRGNPVGVGRAESPRSPSAKRQI